MKSEIKGLGRTMPTPGHGGWVVIGDEIPQQPQLWHTILSNPFLSLQSH